MTNWIKLTNGDSYLDTILASVPEPSSTRWIGDRTFHAWVDIDTGNWCLVHADAKQQSTNDGEGDIVTLLYVHATKTVSTFTRRLGARYVDDRAAQVFGQFDFAQALNTVANDAATTFGITQANE